MYLLQKYFELPCIFLVRSDFFTQNLYPDDLSI